MSDNQSGRTLSSVYQPSHGLPCTCFHLPEGTGEPCVSWFNRLACLPGIAAQCKPWKAPLERQSTGRGNIQYSSCFMETVMLGSCFHLFAASSHKLEVRGLENFSLQLRSSIVQWWKIQFDKDQGLWLEENILCFRFVGGITKPSQTNKHLWIFILLFISCLVAKSFLTRLNSIPLRWYADRCV